MQRAYTPQAPSKANGNVTTAPAGGAILAQLTSLPAGQYLISFKWMLTGTAETGLSNMGLYINGSALTQTAPTISASGWANFDCYADINANGNAYLSNTSAATAGAVYSSMVVVTMIAPVVN